MSMPCRITLFKPVLILFILNAGTSWTTANSLDSLVLPLWSGVAPGSEGRSHEAELAKDWWVKNIHSPSLTAYFPDPALANGTSVIICPGGGHRELVFNAEGVDAAKFFNRLGITAFILKYRLAREEGSPYQLDVHVPMDAWRAVRLVRHKAKEWRLNPERIGLMGFSAGGEVVASIAYKNGQGDAGLPDPVDRENGKPSFQILVYPGPLWIPASLPGDAPPAFMVTAIDDACCSGTVLKLLSLYHAAHLSAEAHIYAQGKHAFNMGQRSTLITLKTWPQRLADWLQDNGYLTR